GGDCVWVTSFRGDGRTGRNLFFVLHAPRGILRDYQSLRPTKRSTGSKSAAGTGSSAETPRCCGSSSRWPQRADILEALLCIFQTANVWSHTPSRTTWPPFRVKHESRLFKKLSS